MAKNLQINGVIIQYCFLERVNPISNKFSFNCLIPQDHPQVAEIMAACSAEWLPISAGQPETSAQSMGYIWVMPNDAQKIHPDVAPLLDPSKQYMMFKGVQEANTTTPTIIYDGASQVITNRNLIGDGTIANVSVNAFGYQASGQKGVKFYGQWVQIVSLVESKYAGAGAPPAAVANGYVAPPEATAPVMAPAAAPEVPGVPAQPVQAAYAAAAGTPAPTAPVAAPVPPMAPAAPVAAAPVPPMAPAAPVAPVAPVAAAPVPPMAPAAPAAPMPPVAPAVPVQ